MPLHEMTIQQRFRTQRQFEVDLHPHAQDAQIGSTQRLRYDVSEKDWSLLLHHGKAAAIDGDAAPDLQLASDPRVVNADAARVRYDHLGDFANYPCEHLCTP